MKKKISFIHCADLHLDAPFSKLGQGSFSQRRRQDLKEVFLKIISLVQEKNADFLVISGDLYEHAYVTGATVRWMNEQFTRLAGRQCIIVPGNHDPCVRNSWYRSYPWHSNVHILTTQSPAYLDEQTGTYFYGIGFDTFRQEHLPLQEPPQINQERINLCLFHGTVDMAFTQNAYNPVTSKALLEYGFDCYALGHFHRRNEAWVKEGLFNPGSPEPLGFDELGEHGVYWVSIEKDTGHIHREYEFIPVQKRRYVEIDLNVTGLQSQLQIQEKLINVFKSHVYQHDIVRVRLTGRKSPDLCIDLNDACQPLKAYCFYAELMDCTQPEYDLDKLAAETNIIGVYTRLMLRRMEQANEEERRVLEKALYLGLEALLYGNVG